MRTVMVLAALIAAAPAVAEPAEPLGKPPLVVRRALSDPPNAAAIGARIWVPGLDEGFVPQGLAWADGKIALAGYVATERTQDKGPCRLLWIDPATAQVTRRLDLPPACGHAGGLARLENGKLLVADTHVVFIVGNLGVEQTTRLEGALAGSFADFDGRHVWLGRYNKARGKLWRFSPSSFLQPTLSETDAIAALDGPPLMQGLAFDAQGRMWATASGGTRGDILRLDEFGRVAARYEAPAGVEDIAFSPDGKMWASSEAGTRRWSTWATFFPLIFSIDVKALRETP
ncbi:MAG: hypothetical protein IPL88_10415 [Rhizobiales bacterium]|nr:hypothetical protein [Hyphomicrobiales bacterium]